MRGLYIGRFQPFHLGHQAVLQKIAEEVDEVVIAIGSAQVSHTAKDPFTAGERLTMIMESLQELRPRCYVLPLWDLARNAVWVSHVQSMTPHFDLVYSNNPLVAELFSDAGIPVRKSPLYRREIYSGTTIRRLMIEGGDWRSLVPGAVASIIDEIGGEKRLKNISRSDAY
jgi:nicotinamide-nucleotide adenylyltransferase